MDEKMDEQTVEEQQFLHDDDDNDKNDDDSGDAFSSNVWPQPYASALACGAVN